MKAKKDLETRLRLINTQGRAVRFILEPWGRVYVLRPDDEFMLVFRGPEDISEPEVVLGDKEITVWGPAAQVDVFKNGEVLTEYVPEEMPAIGDTAS